jgi:hypothetical protein
LRAAADELLDELDQSRVFADLGPLRITGSYISELMCWRDLDVGLLVGPEYAPRDVVQLISRVVVTLPGVVGFDYRDERGGRCPTGQVRDERYHVPFLLDRAEGTWRFDLSLWLHDPQENVTSWHQALRASITDGQRAANYADQGRVAPAAQLPRPSRRLGDLRGRHRRRGADTGAVPSLACRPRAARDVSPVRIKPAIPFSLKWT